MEHASRCCAKKKAGRVVCSANNSPDEYSKIFFANKLIAAVKIAKRFTGLFLGMNTNFIFPLNKYLLSVFVISIT